MEGAIVVYGLFLGCFFFNNTQFFFLQKSFPEVQHMRFLPGFIFTGTAMQDISSATVPSLVMSYKKSANGFCFPVYNYTGPVWGQKPSFFGLPFT